MADLTKNVVVYYHYPCLDGFGAAVAARKHFGTDADYAEYKHGGEMLPPPAGAHLLFVDCCPLRPELEELLERGHRITVLDHHKTAVERLEGFHHENLHVEFDMDRSGAVITWQHFFPNDAIPKLLRFIQDRDLWNWQYPDTEPVTAALMALDYDFFTWRQLIDYPESLISLRDSGDMLVKHKRKTIELVSTRTHYSTIGNYEGIPTVNSDSYVSDLGHTLVKAYPDAPFVAIWCMRRDGTRKYSLRSDGEFDCSKIAKQYGGGGHKAAAGFVVP